MHGARDLRQPLGPVIDRIHRGHHRQQHLRGADVGGRLLAADVLLAGLQREAIGRRAARIDRQADETAGHGALERILHRHVGGVRSAIAHRHAEALRRADRDVGAEFTGRGQQRQRQQVGGDDRDAAFIMECGDRGARVAHRAVCAWILKQRAEHLGLVEIVRRIADDQRPAERLGAGAQHRQRLRMHRLIDEERVRLHLRGAMRQRHRFRRRGRLVEQRGVGDIEAGQIADHGLEIEQRLQPALADLGLIRRVGGVPGWILQNVALDDGRQNGAGIALTDQRGEHAVARGKFAHMRQRLGLAQRRAEIERLRLPDRGRQRLADQRVDAGRADAFQHRGDVARRGADMPAREVGGGFVRGPMRGHEFILEAQCCVFSSCPALCRAYTSSFFRAANNQGVDGRDKPGHDDDFCLPMIHVCLTPYAPCRRLHPSGRRARSCRRSSA